MDDAKLVERSNAGDMAAFEELVTRYEKKVYALTLRLTGRSEDAFDLTQDIFIKVFQSLFLFRGESAFSTWLYRLSYNVCIDHERKRKRQITTYSLEDDAYFLEPQLKDDRFSPEIQWENKQLREEIQMALLTLSAEHRMMVLMRDVQGLSYKEIAQALDVGEGTVKSRIFRAREAMRKKLTASGNFLEKFSSN